MKKWIERLENVGILNCEYFEKSTCFKEKISFMGQENLFIHQLSYNEKAIFVNCFFFFKKQLLCNWSSFPLDGQSVGNVNQSIFVSHDRCMDARL